MTDAAPLQLHYHPFSRAANVVWMLEELGRPYTLVFVDLEHGAQRSPEFRRVNPMGKLPALLDAGQLVTESAAIAMYLADRYAHGTLCPRVDAPERGTYLRWIAFSPAVIEPACYAKAAGWAYRAAQAGWGTYDDMVRSVEQAIGDGPYLLGEQFTMADVVFGGTLRYMLRFRMIDERPAFASYVERLSARPAALRADARNQQEMAAHGLGG